MRAIAWGLIVIYLSCNTFAGARSAKNKYDFSLNQYRYVFISGFLNEALPIGFADSLQTLQEMGIDEDNLTTINLSSSFGVEENSERLFLELKKINKHKRKPMVLFAHSKGALETLIFASKHPDFIMQKVQSIYLIQGVLGGSYVADYLAGEGHPVDSQMPLSMAAKFLTLNVIENMTYWYIGDGLLSMTTKAAKALVRTIKAQAMSYSEGISDKIFYISSEEKNSKLSYLVEGSGSYLSTYYGKNDGLLLVKDQVVPGFGKRIMHLECDHLDLVTTSRVSNKPYSYRNEFTRALIKHIFR